MTDREMLKMAAKAAGIRLQWNDECKWPLRADAIGDVPWMPNIDDGDALRLAVKLHLTVRCYMGNACAQATVPGGTAVYIDEINQANHAAAIRRAIVRAAAEIGRALP